MVSAPPDFTKGLEDVLEVFSFVATKEARDVFKYGESRSNKLICPSVCNVFLPHFLYDADCLKKQAASRPFVDARLFPGDRQILTI